MTLIAVPILIEDTGDVEDALERAAAAAKGGANLIEWRVDPVGDEPEAAGIIHELIDSCPVPCIVTCRPADEGGAFEGSEDVRLGLIAAAVRADPPPRYVDVELSAMDEPGFRARIRGETAGEDGARVILSSHDFLGRPADLLQRVEAMANEPSASVHKIAWTARSLRDNLEAFDLLRARDRPTIALCMGLFGLPSRVLAPKFGGFLTFASLDPAEVTAPGQPTLADLRGLYRFDAITPATKVYGVIGWPVGHSRGPELHNAGFTAVSHDGVYLPLPVAPEWEPFNATLGALLEYGGLDFRGASVTLPHKANLLRFVRERGGDVDPAAERIGAANTLVVGDDGSLHALNTDAPALVDVVASAYGHRRAALQDLRVAVLGAGGVARAAVAGLTDAGAAVTIFNRTEERAFTLAEEFGATSGGWGSLSRERYDVYVNATSVGMTGGPDPDGSPLPDDAPLDRETVVLDTVYTPRETPLLVQARGKHATALSGVSMFVGQAALQFERWTGRFLPDEVRRVF